VIAMLLGLCGGKHRQMWFERMLTEHRNMRGQVVDSFLSR
jgi:hypothetical protein